MRKREPKFDKYFLKVSGTIRPKEALFNPKETEEARLLSDLPLCFKP